MEIKMITENMTRGQALQAANSAVGSMWKDAIGATRFECSKHLDYRLVVLEVGTEKMILRCGKLSESTNTKIIMTKLLTMKHKLMREYKGKEVTLDLVFKVIGSMNERFEEACMKRGDVVTLYSYNWENGPTSCLTSGGSWATHKLIRQHTCLSLTQSGTPMKCFVINQENVHNLGDGDMNQILLTLLAFYDINFVMQQQRSKNDLKEEFNHISQEIEFGKNQTNAWRDYMAQAEQHQAKLKGATTWIHMTTHHHSQQEAVAAIPSPRIVHSGNHEVKPVEGAVRGSSYSAHQYWRTEERSWW